MALRPKKPPLKKNLEVVPKDPDDQSFLFHCDNMRWGALTLPSGLDFPATEGKIWRCEVVKGAAGIPTKLAKVIQEDRPR